MWVMMNKISLMGYILQLIRHDLQLIDPWVRMLLTQCCPVLQPGNTGTRPAYKVYECRLNKL